MGARKYFEVGRTLVEHRCRPLAPTGGAWRATESCMRAGVFRHRQAAVGTGDAPRS